MAFIIKRSFPLTLVLQQSVIWSSRREEGQRLIDYRPPSLQLLPPTWFIVQRGTISNFRQQPDSWPFRAVSDWGIPAKDQSPWEKEKRPRVWLIGQKSLLWNHSFLTFLQHQSLIFELHRGREVWFFKEKTASQSVEKAPFPFLKIHWFAPRNYCFEPKIRPDALEVQCNCSKTQEKGGLWGTGWK